MKKEYIAPQMIIAAAQPQTLLVTLSTAKDEEGRGASASFGGGDEGDGDEYDGFNFGWND